MNKIHVMTEEELIAARDRDCAEIGLTWEQLQEYIDDCGCCLSFPAHMREYAERAGRIWFVYDAGVCE